MQLKLSEFDEEAAWSKNVCKDNVLFSVIFPGIVSLSRNCLIFQVLSVRLRMTIWIKLIWHLNLKALISDD